MLNANVVKSSKKPAEEASVADLEGQLKTSRKLVQIGWSLAAAFFLVIFAMVVKYLVTYYAEPLKKFSSKFVRRRDEFEDE